MVQLGHNEFSKQKQCGLAGLDSLGEKNQNISSDVGQLPNGAHFTAQLTQKLLKACLSYHETLAQVKAS